MRCLALLLFVTTAVLAEYFSYDGYKVFRIVPANKEQFKTLLAYTRDPRFDFWSSLRSIGEPVDVMVEPSAQKRFLIILQAEEMLHFTLIGNVKDVIEQEKRAQMSANRTSGGRISFTKYNRHSEINDYLDELVAQHPDVASVEVVGKSHEGRELKVIKISSDPSTDKPVIFVDAGIHAREWAAPALATYIINQLVENPENSALLDKVDWHVLPVVNPDGYEYTHTQYRLWRKTRSKGKICYGVDGNRNFGYHWGEIGASSNECTETFRGPRAFSEPETQTVRDYILKHKDNIKMYQTIHTYGGYILYPWGFTSELPDDAEELQSLGIAARDAIQSVDGTKFTVGSSTNVLYAAAGGSDDWAKGVAGVELSYTLELRGGGSSGFDPPPSQILPIVIETWEGFKVFHKHVEKKFG